MQTNNSQSAKKILSRLKKALKVRTDIELSNILGVQPNTISTWKKRDSLDYSLIISICELYKIDLNHLFLETEKSSVRSGLHKTPLITRETLHPYTLGEFENDASDLPQYNLPFLNNPDSRIFQIVGNHMFPTLEENDFVICERTQADQIASNSILVVISKKKGAFINRVEKIDPTHFLLFHDNPSFKNEFVKISADLIDELWKVTGYIKYNINNNNSTLQQFLNNKTDKIQSLFPTPKNIY